MAPFPIIPSEEPKGGVTMKERIYSVLILSSSATFHAVLKSLLPLPDDAPVCSVYTVNAAKKALGTKQFDFIIVDTPLSDASGKLFAIDAAKRKESVVLLFVKQTLLPEIYDEVTEQGIFTLAKPTSKAAIAQALSWMGSAREHLRRFKNETLAIEKKIDDIRVINRAKWLLISELKLSEPDAHHYIEKQAMDRCITKRKIAEDIIKMYSL